MDKAKIVKSLIYKFTERFAVKGIGFVIRHIQRFAATHNGVTEKGGSRCT